MGWDEMEWDGMGWDGMGWDGTGWDGTDTSGIPFLFLQHLVPSLAAEPAHWHFVQNLVVVIGNADGSIDNLSDERVMWTCRR